MFMILQQNNTPSDTSITCNNIGNVKVPICDINVDNDYKSDAMQTSIKKQYQKE